MKSKLFTKPIQLTLLVLTLFLLNQFLSSGQTITVSSKQICFDELAAQEAFGELCLKDTIIVYQDSLINQLELQKAKTEMSYYELVSWNDKLRVENATLIGDLMREKRERKIWMRSFMGIGAAVIALLALK